MTNIIAEIGLAHDGSINNAHAFIDAVDADIIKFQHHLANYESSDDETFRYRPEWFQDNERFDFWARTSFTVQELRDLADHTRSKGMKFACSPFSVKAVDQLADIVEIWKIPSSEVSHQSLMSRIKNHVINSENLPYDAVIISTGMSSQDEVSWLRDYWYAKSKWNEGIRDWGWDRSIKFLQCTSEYPVPASHSGLVAMHQLHGLSDHSGKPETGLAAAALGAEYLEVHVCWDKRAFGFDSSSSLEVDEFNNMVKGIRWINKCMRDEENRDSIVKNIQETRHRFGRSAYPGVVQKAGEKLNGFVMKKPAGGMCEVFAIMIEHEGVPLKVDVSPGHRLSLDHFVDNDLISFLKSAEASLKDPSDDNDMTLAIAMKARDALRAMDGAGVLGRT